jgi:hypothetical protein
MPDGLTESDNKSKSITELQKMMTKGMNSKIAESHYKKAE